MITQEDINYQISLLDINRRNIKLYLTQIESGVNTPAQQNGLYEARQAVSRMKDRLRRWDILVDDMPQDEQTPIELGKRVTIEIDNTHTILMLPNSTYAIIQLLILRDYGLDISEHVVVGGGE